MGESVYKGTSWLKQLEKLPSACCREKAALEGGPGSDFPYLGIFEDAATEFFDAGLEHGVGEILTVDVEAREGLEETAERK
jgi:hypothetical protein